MVQTSEKGQKQPSFYFKKFLYWIEYYTVFRSVSIVKKISI